MGGSKGHPSLLFDRLIRQRMSATLVLRRGANLLRAKSRAGEPAGERASIRLA